MDLLTLIASEFDIPILRGDQKIWFFRTKGGKYYYDFTTNGFIALGWDLISPDLIKNEKKNKEAKKEAIEQLYPDEKRPGLIFSQMDIFYNRMSVNDLVLIPDEGTKTVAIGIIGEFVGTVNRESDLGEHERCLFAHKRAVSWKKEVEVWQDIYLFKALRAQQTISDITEEAKMVFRNMFPAYISGDSIHLTFQKPTTENLSLTSNVDLLANLMTITDETAELYGKKSFKRELTLKTAVGSPGFLEIVLPCIPVSAISVVLIIKCIIGKIKDSDGKTFDGLLAIVSKVNDIINDYHNRKKTDAEVKQIEANTKLTTAQAAKAEAEAQLLLSQIAKTNAEARRLELENSQIELLPSGKTTEEIRKESEQIKVPNEDAVTKGTQTIFACGCALCNAAQENGLSFGEEKIKTDDK